jgi:hypothetical protein
MLTGSSSVAPENSLAQLLILDHFALADNPIAHDPRRRYASADGELPAVVRHHVCRKRILGKAKERSRIMKERAKTRERNRKKKTAGGGRLVGDDEIGLGLSIGVE